MGSEILIGWPNDSIDFSRRILILGLFQQCLQLAVVVFPLRTILHFFYGINLWRHVLCRPASDLRHRHLSKVMIRLFLDCNLRTDRNADLVILAVWSWHLIFCIFNPVGFFAVFFVLITGGLLTKAYILDFAVGLSSGRSLCIDRSAVVPEGN